MNENAQLRVYVSKKYFPIFHEITRQKLFAQNSEFFIFCTFLGKKNELIKPLEKRHELCRAATLGEYDRIAIKSLYLKENGELSSFKDMIRFAEEYANGGIEYLIETTMADMEIGRASCRERGCRDDG